MTKIIDPDTLNIDSIIKTDLKIIKAKEIKKVKGGVTFDDMIIHFKKLLNEEK